MALGTRLPASTRSGVAQASGRGGNSSMGYTPPVSSGSQYGGSMSLADQASAARYRGQAQTQQYRPPPPRPPVTMSVADQASAARYAGQTQAYERMGYTPGVAPSPFDQAYNYYTAQNGAAMAQLGLADSMGMTDIAQANANADLMERYGQQDIGFGNRQYDLTMGGIGIDRDTANRQYGYYGQLSGMANANLARQLGLLDESSGLYRDSAARQQAYIGQQQGFNTEGYNLDVGNINQNHQTALRQQREQAAMSGSNTSFGNRWALGDIAGTHQYQLGQADLGRRETDAGLVDQGRSVQEQLARQLLGIKGERGDLQYSNTREQLGYREQQAQTQDRLRHLDIRAGEAGLTRDQMQSGIQRQLERSQLDRFFGVADVLAALDSNDIQRQQLAEQIIRQATAGVASGMFG